MAQIVKNGYWGIKIHQRFYNNFKYLINLTVIKVSGLEWLGYILRMVVQGQYRGYWKAK